MSHEATNWAIKQRGLKPAAKVVLWHLCDRYHVDHGCFPSLDTLAVDCEMSRRSVQDQLDTLETAGLIQVEKMPRQHGRMPRNRYRFAFEDGVSLGQILPLAESALGKETPSPLANSDNHLGQNLPTNPVRVTSKRTGKKDADAAKVLSTLSQAMSTDVAKAFIDMRRIKRAVITEHAADLIAKSLRNHPCPDAVVQESIKNGWTGIFPDKFGGPRDQFAREDRRPASAVHSSDRQIAFAARAVRTPSSDCI